MAKTLDQVVTKWATNAGGASQAWLDGINSTTVDPTALAAANSASYLAGVQAAVSTGLWQRKLAAAGKAKWQAKSNQKSGNFIAGVDAGKDDYQQSMTTWLPIIQQTGATAKGMPGNTIDQRIARSAYVQRTLYNRKRGL